MAGLLDLGRAGRHQPGGLRHGCRVPADDRLAQRGDRSDNGSPRHGIRPASTATIKVRPGKLRPRHRESVQTNAPGSMTRDGPCGPSGWNRLEAFVLRCFGEGGEDRILVVNLGRDYVYAPISEPLQAPPEGRCWTVLWSSASVVYGGDGTSEPQTEAGWRLPRRSIVVFAAMPANETRMLRNQCTLVQRPPAARDLGGRGGARPGGGGG